jgi:hypothetical protein
VLVQEAQADQQILVEVAQEQEQVIVLQEVPEVLALLSYLMLVHKEQRVEQ